MYTLPLADKTSAR